MQPPNKATSTDRDTAFTRIVHDHARFLYRVAYSLLRHPQDAEDAVQDALLKLYRGEAWRTMQDERAFLARVVWRSALDRHAGRPVALDDDTAGLRLPDLGPSPEDRATDKAERLLRSC